MPTIRSPSHASYRDSSGLSSTTSSAVAADGSVIRSILDRRAANRVRPSSSALVDRLGSQATRFSLADAVPVRSPVGYGKRLITDRWTARPTIAPPARAEIERL